MSNRPFMAYGEGDYAQHYLDIVGAATDLPIFAHVNWFQRDPEDGHFLWPGYRDNLRPLLWLLQLRNGEVEGRQTPVGIVPREEELNLEGVDITPKDLETILSINNERWQQEMVNRAEHLEQFDRMPDAIWEAHRRVTKALEEDGA
jgi:phosphoenolpyruvate carboxykinase (GTP)